MNSITGKLSKIFSNLRILYDSGTRFYATAKDTPIRRFVKKPFFNKFPSTTSPFKKPYFKKVKPLFLEPHINQRTQPNHITNESGNPIIASINNLYTQSFADRLGYVLNQDLETEYAPIDRNLVFDMYGKILINSIITGDYKIFREIISVYEKTPHILSFDDVNTALYASINYGAFINVKYMMTVVSNNILHDKFNELLIDMLYHSLDVFDRVTNKQDKLREIIRMIIFKYDPKICTHNNTSCIASNGNTMCSQNDVSNGNTMCSQNDAFNDASNGNTLCSQNNAFNDTTHIQNLFNIALNTNDHQLICLFIEKFGISSKNISRYLIWSSLNPINLSIICEKIPGLKYHDQWTINAITNYDLDMLCALFDNGFDTNSLIKGGYTVTDYINCLLDTATDEKKIILKEMREATAQHSMC